MKILNLKTERMCEPVGIDRENPVFSWQFDGENVRQKTYRVQVASNRDALECGRADMWDSGEVADEYGFCAEYAGKPLKSRTEYWWRIEADGSKSAAARFETAFLHPEREFSAEWIGMPLGFGGATDCYRLDIPIEKPVKRARLYVAALGTGRIYLNGKLLDDCYFDGALSVYSETIYYRTYPLDLEQGRNALCLEVGYGFYGAKKIYGQVFIENADGTVCEIPTMAGRVWNVKKGAVVLQSLYDGETYDARREDDWREKSYRVSWGNWVAGFAADPPKGKLTSNPIPPMRIVDVAPAVISERDGRLIADAGVNICGFLRLSVRGARGADVTVRYAERLLPDGGLDSANLRAAECTDRYILKGGQTEVYAPQFTYHGFRYAEIVTNGSVEVVKAEVLHLRSDVEPAGKFSCSDDVLNRLHGIAVRTESNNLNGVFTDCPQRDERLGWLNDLTARLFESVCNFDLQNYLSNFVNMITETQNGRGEIPDTVPFSVGCTVADPVSAYLLPGLLAWHYYGDKRVLKENYEGFAAWVDCLKGRAVDGLLQFSLYGDWCPARIYAKPDGEDTFSALVPKEFMSAIYLVWNLKMMRSIAAVLNRSADVLKYDREITEYAARLDSAYYNAGTGMYGGGNQTECAVAMTVFPEDAVKVARWAEAAAGDIAARDFHTTCGNQGYRHLFYRLAENGRADTLVSLLKNPEYPGWGFMLEQGATTVWERWENEIGSDMHSFNHPMFAAYDGFFFNYIAGIRMNECRDAFGYVVIEPCFVEGLSFAEAEYETVRGKIYVRWEADNNGVRIDVGLPANSRGILRVHRPDMREYPLCGGVRQQIVIDGACDGVSCAKGAWS